MIRLYLMKLSRTVLGAEQSSHVVVATGSRAAAEHIVREEYQLGKDYKVVEMMSWPAGKPVQIFGALINGSIVQDKAN